ncbi:hypothetical protein FRC03_000413, partial [Tulasnella sp. 419]
MMSYNTFGYSTPWPPIGSRAPSGNYSPRSRTSGDSGKSSSSSGSSKRYYDTPEEMSQRSHSPEPTPADFTPRRRPGGLPMIGNNNADQVDPMQDRAVVARATRLLQDPGEEFDHNRAAAAAAFVTRAVDVTGRLEKSGRSPVAIGGNSDIWKGRLKEMEGGVVLSTHPVAIKILRGVRIGTGEEASARLLVRLRREIRIWEQLNHDHIVPLLGFTFIDEYPCMVAPWYESGTVIKYIHDCPEADKSQLILNVIDGLIYLHSYNPPIIHGDIKGANVLIDDRGCAQIADFGLSQIFQEGPSGFTTTSGLQGSLRWMAPELFIDDRRTTASDVYAFALLALEIYSGGVTPFRHLRDPVYLQAITQGAKPDRSHYSPLVLEEEVWLIFERSWCSPAEDRLTIVAIKGLYADALAGRYNLVRQTRSVSQISDSSPPPGQLLYQGMQGYQYVPQQRPNPIPHYNNSPPIQPPYQQAQEMQRYQYMPQQSPNPIFHDNNPPPISPELEQAMSFQHLNVGHPLFHLQRQASQQTSAPSGAIYDLQSPQQYTHPNGAN